MKLQYTLSALALAAMAATTAQADAVVCSDSVATIGNPGYLDCRGPIDGNVNGDSSETTYLNSQWGGTWTWQGKSDDSGSGPFAESYNGQTAGTLTFDNAVTGLFVLAIKGGPNYSYYQFDGGVGGVTSLAFDTLGITTGGGNPGPGLSHFGLYTAAGVVPEPETYALMLGGLLGVGFMVRRRTTA